MCGAFPIFIFLFSSCFLFLTHYSDLSLLLIYGIVGSCLVYFLNAMRQLASLYQHTLCLFSDSA